MKLVEAKEVVLYLAKRLATQALAGAWENEFDHELGEGEIACLDDEGHVVAVRLTPEQYAEVEGKEITLIRKPVPRGSQLSDLILKSGANDVTRRTWHRPRFG